MRVMRFERSDIEYFEPGKVSGRDTTTGVTSIRWAFIVGSLLVDEERDGNDPGAVRTTHSIPAGCSAMPAPG